MKHSQINKMLLSGHTTSGSIFQEPTYEMDGRCLLSASANQHCPISPWLTEPLTNPSPTKSLSQVGLYHFPGPMQGMQFGRLTAQLQLKKQCHFTCLNAAGKHTRGSELASAQAAANLINLNYSVDTNKQAEATDVAGAFNDLEHGGRKKSVENQLLINNQLWDKFFFPLSPQTKNNMWNVFKLARLQPLKTAPTFYLPGLWMCIRACVRITAQAYATPQPVKNHAHTKAKGGFPPQMCHCSLRSQKEKQDGVCRSLPGPHSHST